MNQETLEAAQNALLPEDYLSCQKILSQADFFEPKGRAMHTTNDFYFFKILKSGRIATDNDRGMYHSKGAFFTNGNFPEAITFQLIFEDQNTYDFCKKLDSQKYSDKVSVFVKYLWDNKREEIKHRLEKISSKQVETFEEVLEIAESFRFKARPQEIEKNLEALSKLYAVTIVYEQDKLQDARATGSFELQSLREGGVPISEASIIFVPEVKISTIKKALKKYQLEHIDVRPSEELELIRIINFSKK
jgi:hypothetical protein